MIVVNKRKSTVKIIGIINTVLISECCHSYCGRYILAHFGKKRNKKLQNAKNLETEKVIQKIFGGVII